MTKRKTAPKKNQSTEEYPQSIPLYIDQDAPVKDGNTGIPRPVTFDELAYNKVNVKPPPFDMDSDLGA